MLTGSKEFYHIRGTSTLNGSVEPLIVIDGVPYTQELDDDFDFLLPMKKI